MGSEIEFIESIEPRAEQAPEDANAKLALRVLMEAAISQRNPQILQLALVRESWASEDGSTVVRWYIDQLPSPQPDS